MRCCPRFLGWGILLSVVLQVTSAKGVAPSDSVFPDTTRGYLSLGNWAQLEESFNKTQLGQLAADPVMKPFAEDLKRQLQEKWTARHQKLGLVWSDLEGVPAGEIAVGLIQPSKTEAALALVVDVTGHLDQTNALLAKVSERLTAAQAKRSEREVEGTKLTIFESKSRDGKQIDTAVYFVKDDLLVASDDVKVAEGMLGRIVRQGKDNLAGVKAYAAVMKRCQDAAGELKPHFRWFVNPFGYAEALRTAGLRPKKKGTDFLKIFSQEGFTAIQGAGGYVNFAAGKYELLHRTAVYAPPTKPGSERYEHAARMLDFPNGGKLQPFAWVPRDIATYASLHWNVSKAFESSQTLVDRVVGEEGVFEEVITSIKGDPNGPQIDIRRDLVGMLSNRVTLLSDYQLPITPKSERILVAVEASNAPALAQTIEKWMKSDPDAQRREFKGHVVWEIVEQPDVLPPMIVIEATPSSEPEEKEERHLPPNSAVAVAHGHLLIATHTDLLYKVLSETAEHDRLIASADYKLVAAELEKLEVPENALQAFSRTDEEYRAVYELVRTGKMPEAETMLGKLLNNFLGEGKPGVIRKQRIDGEKLPDFEAVRRYFGPGGMTMVSEPEGWFLVGFTVTKEKP